MIIELCKATNTIKLALESFMAATKTIETKLVNQDGLTRQFRGGQNR